MFMGTLDDGVQDNVPGMVIVDTTQVDGKTQVVFSVDWVGEVKSLGFTMSAQDATDFALALLTAAKQEGQVSL